MNNERVIEYNSILETFGALIKKWSDSGCDPSEIDAAIEKELENADLEMNAALAELEKNVQSCIPILILPATMI